MKPPIRVRVEWGHYDLLTALAPKASSYLEVGTYNGESLRAVIHAHPTISAVACCDSWAKRVRDGQPAGHDHVLALLRDLGYAGQARMLDGDSDVIVPRLAGERFDLTLIDGQHVDDQVYRDLVGVWPLTSWAMVVHDIWLKAGVRSAFYRFLRELPSASATCALCAGDHGTVVIFRVREG